MFLDDDDDDEDDFEYSFEDDEFIDQDDVAER